MRAATYSRTGGPEVLDVVDRAVSEPGHGEVRVRVHRSGVNPTDWKSRRGSQSGVPVDPPQVPNQDGAGVVDAVGAGVEPGLLGQRVWVWEAAYGRTDGTAQEYAIVPRRQAVTLPAAASFDLGASLGVPYLTAHRCLTVAESGPVRLDPGALEGRVVLVAGGAGAVGHAAIQLARWADATVIATVSSPQKAQLAAAAGAHHVINYRQEQVTEKVGHITANGVDVIVEVAAPPNAATDVGVLAPGGAVAIYADTGGPDLTLPIRQLMQVNARWQFVLLYTVPAAAKATAVEDVTVAARDGACAVGEAAGLPLHHYPLERVSEAHSAVEAGTVGKVLIDVA